MFWILGEDGRTPVGINDSAAWAEFMHVDANKRVGLDCHHEEDITVSTTFLGIDHSFTGGLPVLFETMIFGGQYDDYQLRYTTWEDAERGHQYACELAGIQRRLTTWLDPAK